MPKPKDITTVNITKERLKRIKHAIIDTGMQIQDWVAEAVDAKFSGDPPSGKKEVYISNGHAINLSATEYKFLQDFRAAERIQEDPEWIALWTSTKGYIRTCADHILRAESTHGSTDESAEGQVRPPKPVTKRHSRSKRAV